MPKGPGSVIIPASADVWPHELDTARALAAHGHTVRFLPRIGGNGVKSADILMDGAVWEMKSPRSGNLSSLQKNLRRAGKQSRFVIVDIARMRGISDAGAERELRRLLPLVKSVRRIILITKSKDEVDIP